MELRVKGIKNHFKLMRMLIHIRPYNGENTKYTYAFKHVSTRGNIGMQTTGVGAFAGWDAEFALPSVLKTRLTALRFLKGIFRSVVRALVASWLQ